MFQRDLWQLKDFLGFVITITQNRRPLSFLTATTICLAWRLRTCSTFAHIVIQEKLRHGIL